MRFGWSVIGTALAVIASSAPVTADCGALNPAAVQAANEGDQLRATDIAGAISKYKQASELAPRDHRILWKLALACEKKEIWSCVEQTVAKALTLAPKHATYALLRGVALARISASGPSDWPAARAALEQAVALDANLGDAHFELAEVLLHLGDEQAALVHYTKAAELMPEQPAGYAALADLYLRLGFDAQAEKTLAAGEARIADETKKFAIYTLHGDLLDNRGDAMGATTQYERAKRSCGLCTENGQYIAFFNLGASYAVAKPPRKAEAIANLQAFQKMVCKGARAQHYADQCMQAQQLAMMLGGTLQ